MTAYNHGLIDPLSIPCEPRNGEVFAFNWVAGKWELVYPESRPPRNNEETE